VRPKAPPCKHCAPGDFDPHPTVTTSQPAAPVGPQCGTFDLICRTGAAITNIKNVIDPKEGEPAGSFALCASGLVQIAAGLGLDGCVVVDSKGWGFAWNGKAGVGPSGGVNLSGNAVLSSQDIDELAKGGDELFVDVSAGEGLTISGRASVDTDSMSADPEHWKGAISAGAGVGLLFTPIPPFAFDVFAGISKGGAVRVGHW